MCAQRFYTESDCGVVIGTDPVDIDGFNDVIVGVRSGIYSSLRAADNQNVTVVNLGEMEFTSHDANNIRNNKGLKLLFNNVPGIVHGAILNAGLHIFEIDENEYSYDITIEGFHIVPQTTFPAIKITPVKTTGALISNVLLQYIMVTGGHAALYLGSPNWTSDEDNEGIVDGITVKRTIIAGTGDGIQFKACRDALAEYNLIRDTRLVSSSSQSAIGVMAGDGGAMLRHNKIFTSEGDGIHITSAQKGIVYAENNLIVDSGDSAIRARNNETHMNHNTIFLAQEYGLNVSGRSTRSSAEDNIILGCSIPVKTGGSPPENFTNNHTEGNPVWFKMLECLTEPPPIEPPPPEEPRIYRIEFLEPVRAILHDE